jgi:hypothetical protein
MAAQFLVNEVQKDASIKKRRLTLEARR